MGTGQRGFALFLILWDNLLIHLIAFSVVARHQKERVTYSELDAKSNALARGLESKGVQTGDRVGVMLGNSMEYAIVRLFLLLKWYEFD